MVQQNLSLCLTEPSAYAAQSPRLMLQATFLFSPSFPFWKCEGSGKWVEGWYQGPEELTPNECWEELRLALTLMTTSYAEFPHPRLAMSLPARPDWVLGLLELSRVSACKI